jgi:hypothetical protein
VLENGVRLIPRNKHVCPGVGWEVIKKKGWLGWRQLLWWWLPVSVLPAQLLVSDTLSVSLSSRADLKGNIALPLAPRRLGHGPRAGPSVTVLVCDYTVQMMHCAVVNRARHGHMTLFLVTLGNCSGAPSVVSPSPCVMRYSYACAGF